MASFKNSKEIHHRMTPLIYNNIKCDARNASLIHHVRKHNAHNSQMFIYARALHRTHVRANSMCSVRSFLLFTSFSRTGSTSVRAATELMFCTMMLSVHIVHTRLHSV